MSRQVKKKTYQNRVNRCSACGYEHMNDNMDGQDELVDAVQGLSLDLTPDHLLQRCRHLLDEVTQFTEHLKTRRRLDRVEYRHFQNDIKTDSKALQS